VPCPRIPGLGAQIGDPRRAERVQAEVAHEFEQVGLLHHHDGPVPVLEEMAHPVVAATEGPRVPREEGPEAAVQGPSARPDQEVGVIREQGPGLHREGAHLRHRGQAGDDVRAAGVGGKDLGSLGSPAP